MAIAGIRKLYRYDLQPYVKVQAKSSNGSPVDLSGATIKASMKNLEDGSIKFQERITGIVITDAANGRFEYRWQSGDTDTTGKFKMEFEVTPASGGKFTLPKAGDSLIIEIKEDIEGL